MTRTSVQETLIRTSSARDAAWTTWALWGLLFAVVTALFIINPQRDIGAYRIASLAWLEGRPMYALDGEGFLYLPHAAILYLPFASLPFWLGGICWRLVNLGVFVWGAYRLARLTADQISEQQRRWVFALLTLFALPIASSSGRNGQFNLIMAGLMMHACAEVAGRHWWRASALLWLAVGSKPLALVLMMLYGALHPALLLRLVATAPVFFALPFLFQMPDYVAQQYRDFVESLRISSTRGDHVIFAHFFGALQASGYDMSGASRNLIRMAAAGVTFLACFAARLRHKEPLSAILIYNLAIAYLLVFNPRTEGVTYAILGPSLGLTFVYHLFASKSKERSCLLVLLPVGTLLVFANYELGKFLLPSAPSALLAPLVGIAYFALSLRDAIVPMIEGSRTVAADPLLA